MDDGHQKMGNMVLKFVVVSISFSNCKKWNWVAMGINDHSTFCFPLPIGAESRKPGQGP